MRWPNPIYAILPFIHILVGGAVLYRATTIVGIFAGTLLVSVGAIILQMRHDRQHRGELSNVDQGRVEEVQNSELLRLPELDSKEQNEQSPGTSNRHDLR